jgi:hypothetical protein
MTGAVLMPAPGPSLELQATTGPNGFALQDATPTIISWTAPNDGNLHRVVCFFELQITSAQTGGEVNLPFTDASGTIRSFVLASGGQGAGNVNAPNEVLIKAGTTISVAQISALTAGAATVWAEIWGS